MPFFSVVIPTYNRCEQAARAAESVLAQDFTDLELILVDDGSTDATPLLEEKYAGRLRYLRQENRGVSAARNLGIRASCAPHIAFLDSDDLWLPGKLSAQRAYIAAHPEIRIHQTNERWIRRGRRVNPMKKHAKPEGDIFIRSLELCLVSPSAVSIRRDLFDEAGLFDERLPACEDYDLWLRISWRERVGLVPGELVTRYGGHDDQLSRRFPAMDRFRVYSILRLLESRGDELPEAYRRAAEETARRKCRILMEGARRRGNAAFASLLSEALCAIDEGSYSSRGLERLAGEEWSL